MTEPLAEPRQRLFGVILAAGASTRFGTAKQVATFRDRTLLAHAHRTALSLFGNQHLFVVGAHLNPVMREVLKVKGNVVVNRKWPDGPGASIACAARAIPSQYSGILVWHIDQPLLTPTVLKALIIAAESTPDRCVCASYQQTIGVPAYFPKRLFGTLAGLPAEQGAKAVLQAETSTMTVAMAEAANDVDTPDDLQRLIDKSDSLD